MSRKPRHAEGDEPTATHTSHTLTGVAAALGQRFAEYRLLGKLGAGGMAEVFLAVHQGPSGFRKLLVIKRLFPHLAADQSVVTMFLDEARLASRISHPNVIETMQVGTWEGQYFMAMEYLDGQPLHRLLRLGGARLPLTLAVRIVIDVLEGLHYAHEAKDYDGTPLNVVHRDVSPHNVFITYDGVVKLLDFGIAKANTQENRTGTGLVKGKFAYMAPEQATADDVDRRADIWSVGVVLWEALTGESLFGGPSDAASLRATLSGLVRPPSDARDEIPPDLDDIVLRALERKPENRFSTGLEMKEALEEWLAQRTMVPRRSELAAYMQARFADGRETQRAVVSGLLAQLDALPTDDGAADALTMTGAAMSTPPPARNGSARAALMVAAIVLAGVAAGLSMVVYQRLEAAQGPEAPGTVPPPGAAAVGAAVGQAPAVDQAPGVGQGAASAREPSAAPGAAPTDSASPTEQIAAADAAGDSPGSSPQPTPGSKAPPSGRTGGAAAPGGGAAPPEARESAKSTATGFLRIDTVPWSNVSVGGRALGPTPIMGASLPVGTHVVTMTNPELGLSQSISVTIREGETTVKRVGLQ